MMYVYSNTDYVMFHIFFVYLDSASEGKSDSPPKRPDNLCRYSQKECNLEKLKGFDFCHKHILDDSASPFKPCDFVSKTNGKKCTNPAPKLPDGQKT